MGRNATAYFGFGFHISIYDEEFAWDKADVDPEEYQAMQQGWTVVPFVDAKVDPEGYKAWSDNLSVQRALEEKCPVEIEYGSSDELWVQVKASAVSADWGSFPDISDKLNGKHHEVRFRKQLVDYCKMMSLTFEEPHWFLTATYG